MNRILRRLVPVAALLVSASAVRGQSNGPPAGSTWTEPENHSVVVARLMRYHDFGEYDQEIREVVNEALAYLRALPPAKPNEKLAAVFDIDETALSNWDAMADCGFCAYAIQKKYYSIEHDAAIVPVRELFHAAKKGGIAVFFVTGRPESQRQITVDNLRESGYSDWTELVMQKDFAEGEKKPPARVLKSANREAITAKGYHIVLSIGDQASDLAGCCADRVFKVPNPFYAIP